MARTEGEASGAAKVGGALLWGLLRCGRCGRKLPVLYSGKGGRAPRSIGPGDGGDRGSSRCLTVGSLQVSAIRPVGIEAALQMGEGEQAEEDEKRKALELAWERARHEANRARRQFDAVEPENRLAASELEPRWNQALAQAGEVEARLALAGPRPHPLSAEKKEELLTLAEDVTALWNHPQAPIQLKKRILRTVLVEIVVDRDAESSVNLLHLHWAGGMHTELRVERNKTGQHRWSADRALIELVS